MSLWRLLYTGYEKNGVIVKMTLDEAAIKVQISKKSLDDYLMQLRSAKKYGFDFDKHIKEKIGVIRSFVRKMKEQEKLNKQKGISGFNNPDGEVAEDNKDAAARSTATARKGRKQNFKSKP